MSVRVAVRVRPFNPREKELKCENVIEMQNTTTRIKAFKGEEQKDFTFDYSFWSFDEFDTNPDGYMKPTATGKYADQEKVFNAVGKNVLDNAWQGYHCCLFAYGQTGSGKSYSMIGYGTNKGIVPITLNEIFTRINNNKSKDIEFEVSASMLEIYNEEIQDLTIPANQRPTDGLKIRENKLLGVYVEGVKKHFVTSFKEIETVMDQGTKEFFFLKKRNRTVAATQMNATSSRAHTIITVEFKQIQKIGDKKTEKISMINLVDLAGSERQDKTGASGQRLKEAVGINQSLTTLGQVISALAEKSEGKNTFVPYRNSALTRILENALGGNSQTIMICAISPANDNYDETLSTLRYAERAKKIKNKPIVNESESDKMIRELKAENERLKKLLEQRGGNVVEQPNGQKIEIKNEKHAEKPVEHSLQKIESNKEKPIENSQIQNPVIQSTPQNNIDPLKKSKDNENDDDDEVLLKKIKMLEQMLENEKKSATEKAAEARKDQENLIKNFGESLGSIFKGKEIEDMKKKGQKPPPYLENISKDVMIDRKIKIFIDKPLFLVGRDHLSPPSDLVLGGRDVEARQAELYTLNGKVYLKGIGFHVYVNGAQVQKGETLELAHLDRVIFGWNSVFLFKNKDPTVPIPDKYMGKFIDWWFIKSELMHLVDIDASDSEDGGGSCCQIY